VDPRRPALVYGGYRLDYNEVMNSSSTPPGEPVSDEARQARQVYWQRKLGRLRLGAEPLEVQLARYRRVTWMLTAVPLAIGLMFVALFTAFGRPGIGMIVALILLLPIVLLAWLEYGLLARRAAHYAREQAEWAQRRA
jgi:hypothetical protein